MEKWKLSIVLGIVFLIVAGIFIYLKKGLDIWSTLLIILSILDIITGIIRKNR